MQIILQAALLLPRRADEGAQLSFEKQVLAFLGAQRDDQSKGTLGKLGDSGARRPTAGAPLGGLLLFSFGHVGGDFTPNRPQSNENCALFVSVFATGVQAVKVQQRVEDEGIGVLRFAAIDGVDGEEYDVSAATWDVDNGRVLGDVASALHQAGNGEVLGVGITKDDPGAGGGRDHSRIVVQLFVGGDRNLPLFPLGFVGDFGGGTADDEVRIVLGAASRWASIHFRAEMPAARTEQAIHRKNGAIVAVGGHFFVVAIGDGASGIDKARANDGSNDFHFFRVGSRDAIGEPDGKDELGSVRCGEQNAALGHEVLQLGGTIPTKAGAHVGRGVVLADQVWRFRRVQPRKGIAPVGGQSVDDRRGASIPADGRKKDNVVPGVQVW